MDPLAVAGVVLVVVVFGLLVPLALEADDEQFEDDEEFFRERRPEVWGLVGGIGEAGGEGNRCPACGAENDERFRYCGDCGRQLPGGGP